MSDVRMAHDGGVATITLAARERHNALTTRRRTTLQQR
jgi:hypothetical protein